ncbi:hypothetical protein JCM10450v2_000078 [Rhodotorula kratochvilovae]
MAVDLSVSLDQLIATKLGSLSLRDDEDTVDFVRGLVEEDSFEPEDRKSAILGMLEADEEDEMTAQAVDALLEETTAYQDAVAERRRAEEEANSPPPPKEEKEPAKKLTPEQEARRKAEFLKQYGYVEDETEAEKQARIEAEQSQVPSKAFVDPRTLSKKQRKKALDGVDLLALPNLNKHHVSEAERKKRTDASNAAQAKRERDLADRKKQKDDAAKKLEDKRKKAQKVERKG